MTIRSITITVLGALTLSQENMAFAQNYPAAFDEEPAEAADLRDGYGSALKSRDKDYAGEELVTRNGTIVMYRLEDRYDPYEPIPGSNATFIDMKTGTIRTVVPKRGGKLLLNLDIVYENGFEDPVGYVARIGTRKQYDEGLVDLVVGRFDDLEQRTIMTNVRFVDSPTFVEGGSIAMIVWRGLEYAEYTVVELKDFRVSKTKQVDLPEDVSLPEKECTCRE